MERRSFLKAIMAISAGTIVSPAMAGGIGSGNRYQRLITAQHRTILATQAWRAGGEVIWNDGYRGVLPSRSVESVKAISPLHEKLVAPLYKNVVDEGQATLALLNTEFAREPTDPDLAQANVYFVLNGIREVDALSEQDLRQVEDIVANVAVVRSLLQHHAAPINGYHFPEWGAMAKRVGPFMIQSLSPRAMALVRPVLEAQNLRTPGIWVG
jgi:hypothetical protein